MIRYLNIILILFFPISLLSQVEEIPLLERDITICTNEVSAQSVLTAISQQGGFVFSYRPAILPEENVSICVEKQPVRVVLNTLFNRSVEYTIKGKYIILKKSKLTTESIEENKIVEGYIVDAKTGERVTNASVYDKEQMISAITNKYGYFKIEVPSKININELHLSKLGYADTLIIPTNDKFGFYNIKLSAKEIFEATSSNIGEFLKSPLTDSLKSRSWLPEWLLSQPIKTHVRNVSDTLFKRVQISFLPFISTNKLLTANTANDISINILAGYTQEVRLFEIGGILNIVRKNAKSVQLAGVGNIVGGSFNGFQAAGTFNIVRQNLDKVQLAGVCNIVGGSITGTQIGGTFNLCNTFDGAQIAGTLNFSTQFEGAQIAGVINESRIGEGLQLSGVVNTAGEITGVQVAGVTNVTKYFDGTQVAGVVNYSKTFDGVQVAGVTNVAKYFNGYQIATVNIADSTDGIPFGFFSFVKRGYHKLEFSLDEMRIVKMAFRTGVPLFHNIFEFGISPTNKSLMTYSYGLGTSIGKHSKLLWDIDISMNRYFMENNWSSENAHYKLYTGLDWQISKKTSLAAGISYNILHTNVNETEFNNSLSSFVPYTFNKTTYSNESQLWSWIGGKIAIRFF